MARDDRLESILGEPCGDLLKFDRLVTGGIDVWAAFPVSIFAMLLIQAIGIQHGTWVFIVSLALVGWGEVAQFVRSKVIAIKPQPYIEAARSIGAQSGRMLSRHVFPNLLSSLVVWPRWRWAAS